MKKGFTLIELLVVIGIAAMLITMASTSFFGALRQEDATRSKKQLIDIIRTARQQACITGKTHIVVCWNSDTTIQVGNREERAEQGKFAVFSYVGNVWQQGNALCVPFLQQKELLTTLTPGTRVISLADPDAERFGVISSGGNIDSGTSVNTGSATVQRNYAFDVGGTRETQRIHAPIVAYVKGSVSLQANDNDEIPLAARSTQTYRLPRYYKFNRKRTAIIFNPDGSVEETVSLKAEHSKASNDKNGFDITVNSQGDVE